MSSFGFSTTSEEVVDAFAEHVKGRIFLITGTSANGLGANTAVNLARKSPAQLVLVSRNRSKVDPVIEQIASIDPNIKITFISGELSDLDSVRNAAKEINDTVSHIDVIINNAGVMNVKDFKTSSQGVELTLASNHLGHFLLTNLLVPKLKAAGHNSRVVNLSSSGHRVGRFRFDDHNFSSGALYDGWSAYGQSKTANILFAVGLAKRGVKAYAVNPGTIMDTGLATHLDMSDFADVGSIAQRNTARTFELDRPKTQSQGTATVLIAALSPDVDELSGSYLEDCVVTMPYEYASDKDNAERLWQLSEELVGEKFSI